MKFCKTRNVKDPIRANTTDAGIDFFIPIDLEVDEFSDKQAKGTAWEIDSLDNIIDKIIIYPHSRVLIPAGIHMNLEEGTALIFMNKSGVAHKHGLIVGSCVVDSDYQGEVHLSLINSTKDKVVIEAGQKIVQGVIIIHGQSLPTEFDTIENLYKNSDSTRGAGGFGSSGVK